MARGLTGRLTRGTASSLLLGLTGVLAGEALAGAVSDLAAGLAQSLWALPESAEPEPQLSNALGTLLAAGSWPAADILTSSEHQDDDDDDDEADGEHHLEAAEQLADQALENARLRGVCARRGHTPDGFRSAEGGMRFESQLVLLLKMFLSYFWCGGGDWRRG